MSEGDLMGRRPQQKITKAKPETLVQAEPIGPSEQSPAGRQSIRNTFHNNALNLVTYHNHNNIYHYNTRHHHNKIPCGPTRS